MIYEAIRRAVILAYLGTALMGAFALFGAAVMKADYR
jgi:hypothetical protein